MARGGVAIGMLGPLEVSYGAGARGPRELGGRRPAQVLGVLLVHRGQPVPKLRIADLVWGSRQPADPMRTLEANVSVLRTRLGQARSLLRSEPGAYRIALDDVDLDLDRFDNLVARAAGAGGAERVALRRQALALVRGELLADEPYAEWAFPLRDFYGERVLRLQLDLAEDHVVLGEPAAALPLLERVLAAQPARERAHRLLVTAYYAAGEQDRALRAYERCRHVLDAELGVRPLPETERVHLAVLAHEPVRDVLPARSTWPAPARPPHTRFARSGAATIAYQVLGDGPLDVVFAHAWFSHMEIGWEEPRYTAFLQRLAEGRRLIIFDRRGMGMSDPASADVGLDERADDIRAVMDAAGSSSAAVFGSCGSGPIAIALAAREPERVRGLVLFGTFARMLAAVDYPCGWTPEFFASYLAGIDAGWTTGRGIARSVPSAGPDAELMEWLSRLMRLSATPAAARAILDFGATIDVRPLLGRVRAPTLVLHRIDDQWVHPDNGRYLAAHIPNARFVRLAGADHWPWFGDVEGVLRPAEEFLDGLAAEGFPRVAAPG